LQTVRHRFNIYTHVAVLLWRYDAELGIENSLHLLRRIMARIMKELVLDYW